MRFLVIPFFLLSFFHLLAQDNQKNIIQIANFINESSYGSDDLNNQPNGFSYELTKAIMNELDLSYQIKDFKIAHGYDINNDNLKGLLTEYDLVMSSAIPNDFSKQIYYSNPYTTISYDILTRDSLTYSGIADLKDKEIIVKRGSYADQRISELGQDFYKHIIYVNDIHTGVKLLSEGIGTYLVCDDVSSHNLSKLKVAYNIATYKSGLPLLELSYISTNEKLIIDINNTLGQLFTNKSYNTIYDKWLGAKEEKSVSYYIMWVLFSIIICSLIIAVVVLLLRKLVKRATLSSQSKYNKISELYQSIGLLIQNSNIEIYMFDYHEKMLYVLEKEKFVRKPRRFDELLENIHLDDKKQYFTEYNKFINGEISILHARLRIFDTQLNKYLYYEYVFKPLKKDFSGKVYRYIFSRKNETVNQEKILKQKHLIESFDLALKSGNLIRWQYDLSNNIVTAIDCKGRAFEFSEQDIKKHILKTDEKLFLDSILKLKLGNSLDNFILRLKIFDDDTFKPYEISSLVKYDDENDTIIIHGIIKDVSEIEFFQDKMFELQNNIQLALDAGSMSAWKYDKNNNLFTTICGNTLYDISMSMTEFLSFTHPDDKYKFSKAIDDVYEGKLDKSTVTFRTNTGKGWRWQSCSIIAIPSNDKTRFLTGTCRDITDNLEAINFIN